MSKSLHRVNKIEYNKESTLNCSADSEVCQFIEDNSTNSDEESDFIEIEIDTLKEVLEMDNVSKKVKVKIQQDIEFAKKGGNGFVMYSKF